MQKYPNPYAVLQQVGQFEFISEGNYNKIIEYCENEAFKHGKQTPVFTPYKELHIPVRKTEDAAGYDFFLTQDINLFTGESITIPTFIRCYIKRGWMLKLYPRSSYGFKYNMKLANTVGLIDGDYYRSVTDGPDNEGHIMVKIVNEGNGAMHIKAGERFCQGVFEMYGITMDDDKYEKELRNGGIGSTK